MCASFSVLSPFTSMFGPLLVNLHKLGGYDEIIPNQNTRRHNINLIGFPG